MSCSPQPYTLMPHKPNYLLLGSYNADIYRQQFEDPNLELDDVEAKFQFSVKFPLRVNLFDDTMDIYAAYTNRSFWQLYNRNPPLSGKPITSLKHGFSFIRGGIFLASPMPGTLLV